MVTFPHPTGGKGNPFEMRPTMKNFPVSLRAGIIICIWLASVSTSLSQVTITKAQMQAIFTAGNRVKIADDTSSFVNIGKTGGPNLYDFSSLTFSDKRTFTVFQVGSIPQLAVRYPANAVILNEFNNAFNEDDILSFSGDSLLILGTVTIQTSSASFEHKIPPLTKLLFNLNYGMNWARNFSEVETSYVNNVQSGVATHQSNHSLSVDGFGTLRFHDREYQCLRLRDMDVPPQKDKFFFYCTREGALLRIQSTNDQPDTGIVRVQKSRYYLGGNLVNIAQEGRPEFGFSLSQNFPNPFNPTTVIQYQIPKSSFVTMKIFDVLGREKATLISEHQNAGNYSITFNSGALPSGVYFYRLQAGAYSEIRKLVIFK